MHLDLPAHLQQTADILRNSLKLRSDERVPKLPAGLFEDLAARFGTRGVMPAPHAKVSMFGRIQLFISTPAFGLAAAALVILAVALPAVLSTGSSHTTFRGSPAGIEATASTSIVLLGAPSQIVASLGDSGNFEPSSIHTTDTSSGAKVIVDFNSATINAVTADGRSVHTAALPADKAALSAAIVEALSKL